jgi:competence protein ComFC
MLDPPLAIRGWQKWLSRSLDFLYPPLCAICEANLTHGRSLCESCDADLPRLTEPFCATCGESFEGQIDGIFTCPNCSRLKFFFEFARPATVRDDRTLGMIHQLKYGRQLHLAKDLGRLAAEAFSDPQLAVLTGLPILGALQRIRRTEHQTALTRAQRLENLRGAFVITRAGRRWTEKSPAGAVLVDDVLTTGSTVNECAKVLRQAGFLKIFVVTVMRG